MALIFSESKKEFAFGVIVGILVCGAVTFVATMELRDVNRVQQSEIDGLRKKNIQERDSLETQLAKTRDSLSIAFETIRTASAEREEAHKRTQATIRNLQRIIFISHTDSSRNAELKALYKSF